LGSYRSQKAIQYVELKIRSGGFHHRCMTIQGENIYNMDEFEKAYRLGHKAVFT